MSRCSPGQAFTSRARRYAKRVQAGGLSLQEQRAADERLLRSGRHRPLAQAAVAHLRESRFHVINADLYDAAGHNLAEIRHRQQVKSLRATPGPYAKQLLKNLLANHRMTLNEYQLHKLGW